MHRRDVSWLGRDFVELSAEASAGDDAGQEYASLLERFDDELRRDGHSLADTVRTRLWARDRDSRDRASVERRRILAGPARSASSSYISPVHFHGDGRVAVDLLAMVGPAAAAVKHVVEYDPPIAPIRYLVRDGVVVLSGVTSVAPTLERQLDEILPRIEGSLREAGAGWDRVARMSCYLHRSQTVIALRRALADRLQAAIPDTEVELVSGFSAPGKLCEVEVTATVDPRTAPPAA